MIFVGDNPLSTPSDASSEENLLFALMEHPILVSASTSLKTIPEYKLTVPEEDSSEKSRQHRFVYVFQREYATVDPALVDLVGTDEATTCVGLAIRNRETGMTSVAHMDSPKVVDTGLIQMLTSIVNESSDAVLDVHLVGGFDDASPQHASDGSRSETRAEVEGYSFPLCAKIVECLHKRRERFHLQTFHVLRQNTRWDSEGNAFPIFHGFVVETSTGSITPASFDRTSRCPDEIVRRIRVSASFEDPSWKGRLLETYDTRTDRFVIAPCLWTRRMLHIALTVTQMSDTEILHQCSTSPSAEGPDFVYNERRMCNYLIQHPDWRETFPMKQPRVVKRTSKGVLQGVKLSPD